MQTFLPASTLITSHIINLGPVDSTRSSLEACFIKIANQLDNKRLFKQALEGWQILMNLLAVDPDNNYREPKGWSNHPAVKMWRGSELILYFYVMIMLEAWERRGFNAKMKYKVANTFYKNKTKMGTRTPDWMRDHELFEEIASSHRVALLSKNYEHYNQFNWPEDTGVKPDTYDYIWPIPGGKNDERNKTAVSISS